MSCQLSDAYSKLVLPFEKKDTAKRLLTKTTVSCSREYGVFSIYLPTIRLAKHFHIFVKVYVD